ncbi:collagen alpha-1(IV) chain-like [Serinus canaria]|uniref:collagen alpha-1(IV) chain-like n=1 Tax=Serinus canaria TaxID=9135 RepID=UPI0021CC6C3C|nr:collagen alpha-1(IV) chain-like [Serinus canaria]
MEFQLLFPGEGPEGGAASKTSSRSSHRSLLIRSSLFSVPGWNPLPPRDRSAGRIFPKKNPGIPHFPAVPELRERQRGRGALWDEGKARLGDNPGASRRMRKEGRKKSRPRPHPDPSRCQKIHGKSQNPGKAKIREKRRRLLPGRSCRWERPRAGDGVGVRSGCRDTPWKSGGLGIWEFRNPGIRKSGGSEIRGFSCSQERAPGKRRAGIRGCSRDPGAVPGIQGPFRELFQGSRSYSRDPGAVPGLFQGSRSYSRDPGAVPGAIPGIQELFQGSRGRSGDPGAPPGSFRGSAAALSRERAEPGGLQLSAVLIKPGSGEGGGLWGEDPLFFPGSKEGIAAFPLNPGCDSAASAAGRAGKARPALPAASRECERTFPSPSPSPSPSLPFPSPLPNSRRCHLRTPGSGSGFGIGIWIWDRGRDLGSGSGIVPGAAAPERIPGPTPASLPFPGIPGAPSASPREKNPEN